MILLLITIFWVRASWAQADVKALEEALKDKQMELRSYSADPVARYKWADGNLVALPSMLHALGVFTAHSVKQKKDRIIFEGERATLVHDAEKNQILLAGKTPMKLEIDLRGADPGVVLPGLQEKLFFPDTATAVSGLPSIAKGNLPVNINEAQGTKGADPKIFEDGRWLLLSFTSPRYSVPKLISSAAPKFSDEARQAKISGSVTVLIGVTETGRVDDVWLVKPMGFGLDSNAANAVRRYVFEPARYDGRAVGTALMVVVNFQVF